ncbi:MAG: DUF2914 domain-containing protein [Psychroserpens sp.]|uniref:DUF2914 domain-containing protein n=1 Tax=Psychroserpens sp. TaxID=2020870 RepID=UPI003C76B7C7
MKRTLVKYRNSAFRRLIERHKKYAPLIFFVGGFIFDTLTLGRVDRLYDLVVLWLHMTALTLTLILFNLVDDGKWKNTSLEKYESYFPLAIQFFFGGLSSAFVIYFSRSVSHSKTISFFVILVALLLANEFLKKRISNKYLQFSIYFFVNFTFLSFMIPVFTSKMNTTIFVVSGLISLSFTLTLITLIYRMSPSTRAEIKFGKILAIIISIYLSINLFYVFNLIPPVPLALEDGIVAREVKKESEHYMVTYEPEKWYVFWRAHKLDFKYHPGERVYVFTSIFAPTDIEKSIIHRWQWYNPQTETWDIVDNIDYKIAGGRDEGYRAYTYKSNVKQGEWRVEVITKEELVVGVINFNIIIDDAMLEGKMTEKAF